MARVIQSRIDSAAHRTRMLLELGTIQNDYSLKVDTFPHSIPWGQYGLSHFLLLSWQLEFTGLVKWQPQQGSLIRRNTGQHKHGLSGPHAHPNAEFGGEHEHPAGEEYGSDPWSFSPQIPTESQHWHPVRTPVPLKPLEPGDRVLVANIHDGAEFIVISRVVWPNAGDIIGNFFVPSV